MNKEPKVQIDLSCIQQKMTNKVREIDDIRGLMNDNKEVLSIEA